jgi:hypothetical protein
VLAQGACLSVHGLRNPSRKVHGSSYVVTRGRVFLMNLRELLAGEAAFQFDQCRPEPAVHDSHLSVDEPALQQVAGFAERLQHGEDSMAVRVRPPASPDRFAKNRFHQTRHGSSCGNQHGAMLFYEGQGVVRAHHAGECIRIGLTRQSSTCEDRTGQSPMAFARYKGEAEKALLAAGFPLADRQTGRYSVTFL